MKSYKQNPKTFTALQWTGSNLDEFEKEVDCSLGHDRKLEVSYWSQKNRTNMTLEIPWLDYLVIPSYGKMRVLNQSDFNEEFSEA